MRSFYKWWFISIAAMVHLMYYPAWRAGRVTDFIGWLEKMEHAQPLDIVYNFGFPSFQPILAIWSWVSFHTFGKSPLPYHLATTSLHLVNIALLAWLIHLLLKNLDKKSNHRIVGLAIACWAISPYHTDAIVWKVCFNWLGATSSILASLISYLRWYERGAKGTPWGAHLFLAVALGLFELAIVLPFMTLILAIVLSEDKRRSTIIFLQQLVILAAYFLINKLVVGEVIGHYGAEVHLAFPIGDIIAAPWKYLVKNLIALRYWPPADKHLVFQTINSGWLSGLLWLLTIAGFLFNRIRSGSFSNRQKLLVILWGLAVLSILPVSNLYFSYLLHVENDRYGYLFSGFTWLAVGMMLDGITKKWKYLSLLGVLVMNLFFLQKTVHWWVESDKVYRSLIQDFRWENEEEVWLLNLPDNYRGVPMFRDFADPTQAMHDVLVHLDDRRIVGEIREVALYNMHHPDDSIAVRRVAADTLQLQFEQYGNWWWRKGITLTNYDTEEYAVEKRPYELRLMVQDTSIDPILIYQAGSHWRRFDD